MFTLVIVFIFFALMVPLVMAAPGWLLKEKSEARNREWALYEQHYD